MSLIDISTFTAFILVTFGGEARKRLKEELERFLFAISESSITSISDSATAIIIIDYNSLC